MPVYDLPSKNHAHCPDSARLLVLVCVGGAAMMQKRRHSAIESVVNVLVGYGVALGSQIVVFPLFNIHVSIQDNIHIGLWFTIISLIRSYVLRRVFTRWTE